MKLTDLSKTTTFQIYQVFIKEYERKKLSEELHHCIFSHHLEESTIHHIQPFEITHPLPQQNYYERFKKAKHDFALQKYKK